jgi:putative methyltransferase (TIGR04325 family)
MRNGLRSRLRRIAVDAPGARRTVRAVRQWRQARAEQQYQRRFADDCYGCFWGVFSSFEEAARSAPRTKPLGYNHTELATEYRVMLERQSWEGRSGLVSSYDYPAMFWLSVLLHDESIRTVFDFGGNVGVHFYAYGSRMHFPADLRWTVCDVAAIVDAGRQIAAEREGNLCFTTTFEAVDDQDLLFASGSIQYVENIGHMLRGLRRPPRHVLINRLPLYEDAPFVTLQNGGSVFYPQYVFNRGEFVDSLDAAGFALVDLWNDPLEGCVIPFHDKAVPYYGLYLKRHDLRA